MFYLLQLHEQVLENFADVELNAFVVENMGKYFELVQNKVDLEQDVADTNVLVQALDRFYRRIETSNFCGNVSVNVNFIE